MHKTTLRIEIPIIRTEEGSGSEFTFSFDPDKCEWIDESMKLSDFIKGCVERDFAFIPAGDINGHDHTEIAHC